MLPYAVSFGLLPAFVVLALPGRRRRRPGWSRRARLLGAGAHFANVLPDLADDARTGVRGLPHRLGAAGAAVAAAGLLLAATVAAGLRAARAAVVGRLGGGRGRRRGACRSGWYAGRARPRRARGRWRSSGR